MSPLKVIIPLFIVLGLLQAAVLVLPFVYWRFAAYMGPINKFLFGSFLCVNCSFLHCNTVLYHTAIHHNP